MHSWTPDELRDVLDSREQARLCQLAGDLIHCAERGASCTRRSWPKTTRMLKDDVQEVLLYFFEKDASVLRNYGSKGEYHRHPEGFRRYATGVVMMHLRKLYGRERPAPLELVLEELAAQNFELECIERVWDLEHALSHLPQDERTFFDLCFVKQLDKSEICRRLGITPGAFDQRKSRLLAKLRTLLERPKNDPQEPT